MDENPLQLKIQKIINRTPEEEEVLLNGLNSISSLVTNNSAVNRRTLRSNLERIQLDFYENLLFVFGDVKKRVDSVDTYISTMLDTCREMNKTLTSVKSETACLMESAQKLQSDSKISEIKACILDHLVGSYQISSEDAQILSLDVNPIDNTFFSALSRCRQMKNNCKELLQAKEISFSYSMMNSVMKTLDVALRDYMIGHKFQEVPEISLYLRRALSELQEKPVLLKYSLDEYCGARRKASIRLFMDALSVRLDPNPNTTDHSVNMLHTKPIEMRSHDPVRFVSDVLACIHQLTASEKEYINNLCKDCHDTLIIDMKKICLDTITESLCSQFKVSMENLLISHHDAVVLYRINNIMSFYQHTFKSLLESTASLILCVDDVQGLCKRLLLNTLEQFVKQTLEQPDLPNQDLSPNELVTDSLQLLVQMLGGQDISLLPNDVVQAERKVVIESLIFPLIDYCEKSANLLPIVSQSRIQSIDDHFFGGEVVPSVGHTKTSSTATYLANCFYVIEVSLSKIPFSGFQIEQIASKLDLCLDSLVSAQVSFVLEQTGLTQLNSTQNVSQDPNAVQQTKAKLREMLNAFNVYLSNPDKLLLPEVNKLYVQRLKRLVRRRSADHIHSYYQSVYQTIVDISKSSCSDGDIISELYTPQQVAELILNF
ncbi:unnamed protein product [Heterobilharzia americana]|nr:unnamed protein product [Heterobilharzia americana]